MEGKHTLEAKNSAYHILNITSVNKFGFGNLSLRSCLKSHNTIVSQSPILPLGHFILT